MSREIYWSNRTERLYLIEKLFLQQYQKLRTSEIAEKLGVSDSTISRDLDFLSSTGRLPLIKDGLYWKLVKEVVNNSFDDKHLSVETIKYYDYDVALSYASEDRSYVDALATILKREGVKVFYDKYEKVSLWGQDLYTSLSDLYQNKAKYCVLFLSQHYAAKLWTKHELKSAQARAFKEQGVYLLPIRLDDTEIPGVLPTTAYLTWSQETVESITQAILEKLVDFSPKSRQQWFDECEKHLKNGEKEKAVIASKKTISIDPYDWFGYYKTGRILVQLEKYEEALAYSEEGIRRDPANCEDIIYRVQCEALVGLKRCEEALVICEQMLEKDGFSDYIETLCEKGNILFELERYEEAFAIYEEAIQLGPTRVCVYQNKGYSLFLLNRNEEALIAYEQAIKLNPKDAYTYKVKGDALQELEQYKEALAAYEQAIKLDPKDAYTYKVKGDALQELKQYKGALAAYEQAIQLDPKDPDAYREKGKVLRALNRLEEAEQVCEIAEQLHYSE